METEKQEIERHRKERASNPDKKWTQGMTLHLNGGSEFSELHYSIKYDGQEIGIRRTRTNGRPRYLKTIDVIQIGNDEFDVLATKGVGMAEWLDAHKPVAPPHGD